MNPYSLLWVLGAGFFNGIMDSLKHRPWVWDWIPNGRFKDWWYETDPIGKGKPWWMQGPMFIIYGGWHSMKQFMIICFLMAIVSNLPEGSRLFGFYILMLCWGMGFIFIYKGILGGAEMVRRWLK